MATEQKSVSKQKEGTQQGLHVVAKPIEPACKGNLFDK